MAIITAVLAVFVTFLQPNANSSSNTKEGTEINHSGDFIVIDDFGG